MVDQQEDTQAILKERFRQLPKPVQEAITSAEVEARLRELANAHKLHLDQWEALENEILMTLYGILPLDELQANIQKQVSVPEEEAAELTRSISDIVFEPIRTQLERELDTPEQPTKEEEVVAAHQAVPTPVPAGTPPSPTPTERAVRAPISAAYNAGEVSHERKTIDGDPYREQLE